jgi:hypothetical protein
MKNIRNYIAKFLPTKEQVRPYNCIVMGENGVCIIWGGKSRHGLQAFKAEDSIVNNLKNPRSAKLFLVSHDIKQDEDFYNPNDGKTYNAKEVIPVFSGSDITNIYPFGADKLGFTNTDVFKIIGEVSDEAIWVDENDEILESDVKKEHYTEDKRNKHLEVSDIVLVEDKTNMLSQIEGQIVEFKPTVETNGDAWGWNDPVVITNVIKHTIRYDDEVETVTLPDMEVTRESITFKPIPQTKCKIKNKTCQHFH